MNLKQSQLTEQSPALEVVEPTQESFGRPMSLDVDQALSAPEENPEPPVVPETVLEAEPEPEAVPAAAPVSAPPVPAPEFKMRAGVNCVVDGGQVKPL